MKRSKGSTQPKTKKTSTDRTADIKPDNFRANLALGGVGLIALYIAMLVCPPGTFSNWSTGGVEGGNCFESEYSDRVLARIIATSDSLVQYEYVDSRTHEIKLKERENSGHTSPSDMFNGFSSIYKRQVRCGEYDKRRIQAQVDALKSEVSDLRGHLDDARTEIGALNKFANDFTESFRRVH